MSTDIVDIGLSVDSRSVNKGAAALGNLGKKAGKTEKATDKLNSSLKKIAVTVGAVALAYKALSASFDSYRKFGAALSDLSAITGATGKDLKFLSESAKELGIEMNKTGDDVLRAMKLMASAKPELLKNTQALKDMTEQALILSQATRDDLTSSIESLASVMNQFGLDASEGSRVINVLAAASKFGSVEVGLLSESMVKVGGLSSSLGISLETTTALIELLGKKSIKGANAGTQLKGVLISLTTKARDEFNPTIVGMSTALDNLAEANLSTSEMADLFGRENLNAAIGVIALRSELDPLTQSITGTKTAMEQAAIQTDNLDGDVEHLGAQWSSAGELLGSRFDPALRATTQLIGNISKPVKQAILEFTDLGNALGAYAAIAASLLSFDLDGAKRIISYREAERAAVDEKIASIWEEKEAVEAKAGSEATAAEAAKAAEEAAAAALLIKAEVAAAAKLEADAAAEEAALLDAERKQQAEALEDAHQAKMLAIAERMQRKIVSLEKSKNTAVNNLRTLEYNHGIALLQMFAGKSKAIAILLVALQTAASLNEIQKTAATAAVQVAAYTSAAAMHAMATLGPFAGPPAAAAIEAKGAAELSKIGVSASIGTGLVIATGVLKAGAILKGGGNDAQATFAADPATGLPVNTNNSISLQPEPTPPPEPQQQVSLNLGDEDELISVSSMRRFIERAQEVAEDMGPNTKIVIA